MSEEHFLNLQPGTVINGKYEVVKCLGTGSMGMVYACRHRELSGLLVAMKVLFAEVARDTVAAARFRNEIVASYGVSHPNVVRAYEYFRDGDLIAFTMEYIGGGDLADRINHDEPLPTDEICRMLAQMCLGVQAIHDAGIIHRDLKPENILLTTDGDIKITDFGIARCGTGPKLTEHGGVVGTIDYVSPEYLEKGQVDGRSDIYALGVLAYEMITGESPFKGNSVIETMTIRLRSDPVAPSTLRPDCPPGLDRIVLKAMRREPEKRYQKASEIYHDLQVLKNQGSAASSERGGSAATEIGSGGTEASYGQSELRIAHEASPRGQSISSLSSGSGRSPASAISAAAASNFVDSNYSGTVVLDAAAVNEAVRPTEEMAQWDDEYYEVEHLESVLTSKGRFRDSPPTAGEISEPHVPTVTELRGHLPPERMKQLTIQYAQGQESKARKLVAWLFIGFVGIGVGLAVLHWISPGFFGLDHRPALPRVLPLN